MTPQSEGEKSAASPETTEQASDVPSAGKDSDDGGDTSSSMTPYVIANTCASPIAAGALGMFVDASSDSSFELTSSGENRVLTMTSVEILVKIQDDTADPYDLLWTTDTAPDASCTEQVSANSDEVAYSVTIGGTIYELSWVSSGSEVTSIKIGEQEFVKSSQ